jgi:hypothetical protein
MHSDVDPSFNRILGQVLRAMPSESPPPFAWAEFRRRARAQGRLRAPLADAVFSPHPVWVPRARLAIAASLCVLIVSGALLAHWLSSRHVLGELAADAPARAQSREPNSQTEASQSWLASLPDDRAIVRVSSRVAVMDLEDRIALMDDALNAARLSGARPARIQALQKERAQLLQSLVQVRYAETLAAEVP